MSRQNRGRDWRERMIDNLEVEYQVPEYWSKGPVENRLRHMTDKCCLFIFLLYLIAMIITMGLALSNSNHADISKIYDSSGNDCGDGKAKDYPLLYLQKFSKPYKSVCVAECPKFDYNEIKYKTPGGTDKAADYPGEMNCETFNKEHGGLSHTKNPKMDEHEAFSFNKEWVNDYFTETQWENYLKAQKLKCLPNGQISSCAY